MQVEVVAVADEVLRGLIVNTNSTYISKSLAKIGWKVARHTVLPDVADVLERGIREALERSDIVIATGGLGPTVDDITREVAAKIFESGFHYDEQVAIALKRRYGDKLATLKDQATVPSKATVLQNKVGTAPGLAFHQNGKTLILLPGVPPEMEPMLLHEAIPYLQKNIGELSVRSSEILTFSLLSENHIDPFLRQLKEDNPSLEAGIYPGYGVVTVVLNSKDKHLLATAKKKLQDAFNTYLFFSPNGAIEGALHEWLIKNNKTLAFAESCTGGLMAHKITSLADSSKYFLGSFVTYSNQLKEKVLCVSPQTLKRSGAVSQETAKEMLLGLFALSKADFGIAVTGIAGPSGGSKEKPVGTICAAIGKRDEEPDVGTFLAYGSRQTIIMSSSTKLLGALYRKIIHNVSAFPFYIV